MVWAAPAVWAPDSYLLLKENWLTENYFPSASFFLSLQDMAINLLAAFLVGFCVAVPAGPVLLFVIQKTLHYGRWAGFAAGLGSAVIDTLYAAIGLLAMSFISNFISGHSAVIFLAGGCLVIFIGMMMYRKKKDPESLEDKDSHLTSAGFSIQAMGLVLSNPGALAIMMAALAMAGLSAENVEAPVWAVLACVFAGECSYWKTVSYLLDRFINLTPSTVGKMSRVSGLLIVLIGAGLVVRGIILLYNV